MSFEAELHWGTSLTDTLYDDNYLWEQEGPNWGLAAVCSMRLGPSTVGALPRRFLSVSEPLGFLLPWQQRMRGPCIAGSVSRRQSFDGQPRKVEEWGCKQLPGRRTLERKGEMGRWWGMGTVCSAWHQASGKVGNRCLAYHGLTLWPVGCWNDICICCHVPSVAPFVASGTWELGYSTTFALGLMLRTSYLCISFLIWNRWKWVEIFGLQQAMVWLIPILWLFILQKLLEALEWVQGLAVGHFHRKKLIHLIWWQMPHPLLSSLLVAGGVEDEH